MQQKESEQNHLQNQINEKEYTDLDLIDTQILDNIFKSNDEKNQADGLKNLKLFLKENSPSIDIMRNIFSEYFQIEKNCELLQLHVLDQFEDLIVKFNQNQANAIIYKCIFELIQKNIQELKHIEKIKKDFIDKNIWHLIHIQSIPLYLDIFDKENKIDQEEIDKFINILLEQSKFSDAVNIIEKKNFQKQLGPKVINYMTTNENASKAVDFLKRLQLQQDQFPQLYERLVKNCVRYYINDKHWFQVEEIFQDQQQFLAYAVEDYYYREMKNEAYSIFKRHQIGEKQLLKKQDIIDQLYSDLQQNSLKELENPLYSKDGFEPLEESLGLEEKGKYLNLKDYGFSENNIYFIDKLDQYNEWEKVELDLISAGILGFDTEFFTTFTKMDPPNPYSVSLLQISSEKNIYIFDMYTIKKQNQNMERLQNLMRKILEKNSFKAGVEVKADLKKICSSTGLNLPNQNILGILELQQLFLKEKKQKKSGLSFIAEFMLGKALSKGEQMSNWRIRPLRKSQLHYAGLDAMVSVLIVQKFIQQIGEQKIKNYSQNLIQNKNLSQKKAKNDDDDEEDLKDFQF